MKKTLPLWFGVLCGVYAVVEFYVPHHSVGRLTDELRSWASILSAAAFIIGGVNILQVAWPKIRRREPDWPYKIVMLAAAVIMLLAGLPWHKLGSSDPPRVRLEATSGPPEVVVDAPADVTAQVGGVIAASGLDHPHPVEAGTVEVKLSRRVAGFQPQAVSVTVADHQRAVVTGDPPMLWGREGRVFLWLYDHVFGPANATLFALLAFFVASASFRAFRARNVEAALLLGAAILMMVGRAPFGRAISEVFPDLAQWILDVPSNGGRRAIMMGAAIGAIATGLRVVLGIERSHLGSDA